MSTADFQSRFKTVRQNLPSSTPPFQLACNTYTPITPRQSATPPIIFTHANGFHKEIWEPVIARMSPRWTSGRMYAFDCRNQGDSAVLNKDILEDTCKPIIDWYSLISKRRNVQFDSLSCIPPIQHLPCSRLVLVCT